MAIGKIMEASIMRHKDLSVNKQKNRRGWLPVILITAALALVGCGKARAVGTDVTETQLFENAIAEETEIKTIEPPADGWTLEQLNEVMYLNGKPFKLPCNIDDINSDFEIQNNYPYSSGENVILDILYNGKFAFTAEGVQKENETIINGIAISSLGYEADIEKCNLFCINGFNLTDSLNILLKSLGEPFSRDEAKITYLIDDENIELGFIISDDSTINSMYIKNIEIIKSNN